MRYHLFAPNAFECWDWRNPDDPGIGGSETAVVELSRRLARRGHTVTVYGHLRPDTVDDPAGVAWRDHETADTTQPGVWIICRSPKSLDRFQPSPDQVFWLQCQDTLYSEATGGGDLTPERVAKLDVVLALCDTHRDTMLAAYPALAACPEKLVVSTNGIKTDAITELPDLPRDPYRLLWASSPDRGLYQTLQVFQRAREFEPRLNLRIAYGWDNIDKLIAQHGDAGPWKREKDRVLSLCKEGVTLLGRLGQQALWREYQQAGLWVYCTAFTETSCISSMEAQALGAIPVFTPLWALKHNVAHGIAIQGANIDPLVQARYVAAVLRLVRQPALAESIRGEMMPWARARFDWERVVDQYESLVPEMVCS